MRRRTVCVQRRTRVQQRTRHGGAVPGGVPDADRGPICLQCGRRCLPIAYGLPTLEVLAAAERGELLLGGCIVEGDDPTHGCPAGHLWRELSDGG